MLNDLAPAPPFTRSATLYDRIYAARGKDYRGEADAIVELAARRGVTGGRVLDAACGTGAHLVHLRDAFSPAGFDACEEMLAVARAKLPETRLAHADMIDFDLPGPYDLVTCLFASIGYLPGLPAMRRAVAAMGRHLRPGGLLVLEPAVTPRLLRPPAPQETEIVIDGRRLRRRTTARQEDGALVITFDYGRFVERHRITLVDDEAYRAAIADAGLEPELVEGTPRYWLGRAGKRP